MHTVQNDENLGLHSAVWLTVYTCRVATEKNVATKKKYLDLSTMHMCTTSALVDVISHVH